VGRRFGWLALLLAAAIAVGVIVVGRINRGSPSAPVRPISRVGPDHDVSRSSAIESETSIAIDPSNPEILLAGSNVVGKRWMGAYESTDAGDHWKSARVSAPAGTTFCGASDPSVAIDGTGRQYFVFLGIGCGRRTRASIYVARRFNAAGRWQTVRAPAEKSGRFTLLDDRPFLTVDNGERSPHRGRIYLGWTRFLLDPNTFYVDPEEAGSFEAVTTVALVAHSDDRGSSWSRPVQLSAEAEPLEVRLATSRDGTLYATWRQQKTGSIHIARSLNGGVFDVDTFVAGSVVDPERSCGKSRARIPAQPERCVSPNPVVSVDASQGSRQGRVYVTWGTTSLNRSQDVYVAAFDPDLHPLLGVGRVKDVSPAEGVRGPDQFLPASSVDPTTGRLWVCYYTTRGPARRAAQFACTASDDGGEHWLSPQYAAAVASDETTSRANRANGYGDYEGVAVLRGRAFPVWTDGRRHVHLREEIFSAELR
jgi:hypothetical protein